VAASKLLHFQFFLNGEAFTASAGACGVRVVERKTLAVQAAAEFEGGIEQVEKTFEIGHDFYAIIFEYLVVRLRFIVKIQFVRQARTTAAGDADADEIIVGQFVRLANFLNFLFGTVCYENHFLSDELYAINDELRRGCITYH